MTSCASANAARSLYLHLRRARSRHTLLSAFTFPFLSHTHTHRRTCTRTRTLKTSVPSPALPLCGFNLNLLHMSLKGCAPAQEPFFQIQQPGRQVVPFLPGIKHDDHLLMKLDLEAKFIICHVLGFNFEFM